MSENRKFQLNIKFGAGYEAPLLNIEGDTPEEFQANVKFVTDNVQGLVNATTLFQSAYNVAKPQDAPAAPAQRALAQGSSFGGGDRGLNAPQQSAPAPAAGKSCVHGAMVYREAKPGSGKSWKAYFCPTPQNTPGQCSPEFLK